MYLHVMRISTGEESTTSALNIDREFTGFVLEDTKRIKEVAGETRIPVGLYRTALRADSL